MLWLFIVSIFIEYLVSCLEEIDESDRSCPLSNCEIIHPISGFKTTTKTNWPTRAFRPPDFCENPSLYILYIKAQ